MRHSEAFYRLRRQISRRRKDLLRPELGRDLIYPAIGTAWIPSHRENALCEAFIVLFVAELETYLESVVNAALDAYQSRFSASGLQNCGASTDYVGKIVAKRNAWSKNNNTNWNRIEDYFLFVGLNKSKFPPDLWDDIESVVFHRGDIVHNSRGVRTMTDPRLTIAHIAAALSKLTIFDRDFTGWLVRWNADARRLSGTHLEFTPGLGMIGIG